MYARQTVMPLFQAYETLLPDYFEETLKMNLISINDSDSLCQQSFIFYALYFMLTAW